MVTNQMNSFKTFFFLFNGSSKWAFISHFLPSISWKKRRELVGFIPNTQYFLNWNVHSDIFIIETRTLTHYFVLFLLPNKLQINNIFPNFFSAKNVSVSCNWTYCMMLKPTGNNYKRSNKMENSFSDLPSE